MKVRKNAKRWLLTGVLTALFATTGGGAQAQHADTTEYYDGIHWQDPTPETQKLAKAESKLLLIDFFATWCGYCQMQDETSYQDDRVILMTDQLVTARVDEARSRALIAKYEIASYPTVMILDADGREVVRNKGAFQQPEGYVQWLGSTLYKDQLLNLKAELQKKPDDIKLLTIMALIHGAANRKSEVPEFLNKAGDAVVKKFEAGQKITPDKTGQTARALRLLSAYFDSQQDYEHAIPTMHYLAEISSRPREVVATRIALAECYFQMNQTPKAIAELESLLQKNTLLPEEKQTAQAKLTIYKNVPG